MFKGLRKTIKYKIPMRLWWAYVWEIAKMYSKVFAWFIVFSPYVIFALICTSFLLFGEIFKHLRNGTRSMIPDKFFLDFDELKEGPRKAVAQWNKFKKDRDGKLGE